MCDKTRGDARPAIDDNPGAAANAVGPVPSMGNGLAL